MKNYWPFGKLFCKIWITIDDIVTMASVLSIVAITIERYWSINHSVHYRRYTTKTRIRIFSLLIWLIPGLNFAPGIWFLDSSDEINRTWYQNHTDIERFQCIGAYHSHTIYLIIAQINFFAWPLVVIIVLNALIVLNLYRRSRRFPVFVSFRVPENKQIQLPPPLPTTTTTTRRVTVIEQYRRKTYEEQKQHIQQISNDLQTMTVVNESNCCLLDKKSAEVNSFETKFMSNVFVPNKRMIRQ